MLIDGIIILITTQRSGSTWLLDLLRSNPNISFNTKASLLHPLNINYNRYPVGLTTTKTRFDNTCKVELHRGFTANIPNYKTYFPFTTSRQNFYIEKIHPFFFKNDIDCFRKLLDRLNLSFKKVKIIYQSRHPLSSIESFVNYQIRDDTWYPNLTKNDIKKQYLTNITTITKLQKSYPGLTIDYRSLISNPAFTLQHIYRHLWPGSKEIINSYLIKNSIRLTGKKTHQKSQTKFVGNNKKIPISTTDKTYRQCLRQYSVFRKSLL